jgi:hypothetical protein
VARCNYGARRIIEGARGEPMHLPLLRSRIRRRLLVNYRVAPEQIQPLLPSRLRPQQVEGSAIAGVCLIWLDRVRPAFASALPLGLESQNAAHRVAVEWDTAEGPARGVYILRRDTDSSLVRLAGGRLFPGAHGHARFDLRETEQALALSMLAADETAIEVSGTDADALPPSSAFRSLAEASAFFEAGALGYSPARGGKRIEGFLLETESWRVRPFAVARLRSSFFDDSARFPPGTVQFDHALVMRELDARWRTARDLD